MSKTILIIGGAGYIGSHTAYLMQQAGYQIIILDAFLHEQHFPLTNIQVIRHDFGDQEVLDAIFSNNTISTVLHFAALIEIERSVIDPAVFYENNVVRTLRLLATMHRFGVKSLVFSSSCAVYGIPQKIPLDEQHPCLPVNAYGKTKCAIEYALQDYAQAYGLTYISLRYFNAAGALASAGLGEQHKPETHVIPLLLRAALHKTPFSLYGTTHPTRDGSCIRDFIHVLDIAKAHLDACLYLQAGGQSNIFNLGSGIGHSIKELITTTEKICNTKITILEKSVRAGDVPVLVAHHQHISTHLGWQPTHSDLTTIISDALAWETRINHLPSKPLATEVLL